MENKIRKQHKILIRYFKDKQLFKKYVNYINKIKKYEGKNIFEIYAEATVSDFFTNNFTKYITDEIIGVNKSYQLFQNFLKLKSDNKHNLIKLYDKYISEDFIHTQVGGKFEIYLNKNEKKGKQLPIIAYLYNGFEWDNTEEGYFFWCNINKQWIKELNKILQNKTY